MLAGHSIRVTYTSTILAVADRIFFLERSFIVGVDYDAKALIEQCYLDCKLDIRFMTTKALNFARQDKYTRQSLTLNPLFYTQLSHPTKLCFEDNVFLNKTFKNSHTNLCTKAQLSRKIRLKSNIALKQGDRILE